MSQDVFKAPKAKKKAGGRSKMSKESWSPTKNKRRRTSEDFYAFCNIVLEYTQYEHIKQEEIRSRNNTSPLDSGGSTAESFTSESAASSSFSETEHEEKEVLGEDGDSSFGSDDRGHLTGSPDSGTYLDEHSPLSSKLAALTSHHRSHPRHHGDESWELITCYCLKPFSGRPMIECSECDTWIHLSCAKIRRSSIPDVFVCQQCKDSKLTKRKSTRIRSEKKLHSA